MLLAQDWILAAVLILISLDVPVRYLARRSLYYAELSERGLRVRMGLGPGLTVSYGEIVSAEEREAGVLSIKRVRLRLRRWSWSMLLIPIVVPLIGKTLEVPIVDTSRFLSELRPRISTLA